MAECNVKMLMSKPPVFNREYIHIYVNELKAWQIVTEVEKNKQGPMVWMSLPDNESSDIKLLIYNRIGVEGLFNDDRLDKVIDLMKETFRQEIDVLSEKFRKEYDLTKEKLRQEKESEALSTYKYCHKVGRGKVQEKSEDVMVAFRWEKLEARDKGFKEKQVDIGSEKLVEKVSTGHNKGDGYGKVKRPVNKKDDSGFTLRCGICNSFCHMREQCRDKQ